MFRPAPKLRTAIFASLLTLIAAPGVSAELLPLRDEDRSRLLRYHDALGQALEQAFAQGQPADLAQLVGALDNPPRPPLQSDPVGAWRCRMIKIGGHLPLVVYDWFSCRISARAEGGWRLEKLTGSQRTTGVIESDSDRLIYRGAAYVAGTTPPEYAAFPQRTTPEQAGTQAPEVGVLQQDRDDHMRLMLPLPFVESVFNLLEFRRAGG